MLPPPSSSNQSAEEGLRGKVHALLHPVFQEEYCAFVTLPLG